MLLLVSFVLDGRHPFVGWGERGDGCSVPTTKWLWAGWSSGWETSCLSDHLLPENDQAPPVWSHLLSGCQAGVEQTRRKTCWYGSTYQLPEAYSHVLRWLSALGLGGLRWAYSVESHRLNTLYAVCLYERLHTYSGRTEPLYGAGPRGPSREGGKSVCDIDTIIVV